MLNSVSNVNSVYCGAASFSDRFFLWWNIFVFISSKCKLKAPIFYLLWPFIFQAISLRFVVVFGYIILSLILHLDLKFKLEKYKLFKHLGKGRCNHLWISVDFKLPLALILFQSKGEDSREGLIHQRDQFCSSSDLATQGQVFSTNWIIFCENLVLGPPQVIKGPKSLRFYRVKVKSMFPSVLAAWMAPNSVSFPNFFQGEGKRGWINGSKCLLGIHKRI